MSLGIMQPYFFPSGRYFVLMHITDKWVFFDTPQFVRHSWMSRNRILKPGSGWQYIIIPLVHHHQKTPFNQIFIDNSRDWKRTIISQFGHYKRIAPNYDRVINFLEELFQDDYERLSDFNIASLHRTCDYLGISLDAEVYSKMNLDIGEVKEPDEWALSISKAMGIDHYINALNGIKFFDRNKYQEQNVALNFLSYEEKAYDQHGAGFVPDLSILDIMMFLAPEEIMARFNSYDLI